MTRLPAFTVRVYRGLRDLQAILRKEVELLEVLSDPVARVDLERATAWVDARLDRYRDEAPESIRPRLERPDRSFRIVDQLEISFEAGAPAPAEEVSSSTVV